MDFKTKIKLGGITNLADARYAAAAGIDYIGFCFDTNSTNYIAPIKAKEIIDWINGCEIVAEFGDQTIDEIKTISELLKVDLVEINNKILPTDLTSFDNHLIKKINVDDFDLESLKNEIDAYKNNVKMFHLYSSENKQIFEANMIDELCIQNNIIWGFTLNTENIISTLNTYHPYAINVFGGTEEKTGYKDFDELNELLDLISNEI